MRTWPGGTGRGPGGVQELYADLLLVQAVDDAVQEVRFDLGSRVGGDDDALGEPLLVRMAGDEVRRHDDGIDNFGQRSMFLRRGAWVGWELGRGVVGLSSVGGWRVGVGLGWVGP